jgi:RNA polymerase sigma-70 factor (ECF subfamily)
MTAPAGYSDCELVKRLQKGDRTAFKQLFNRYQEKLLFYTIAIVKSKGTAKDIVQETFIKLWTNRHKLDPDQSLSGFLHTIARNMSLNHLKRAGYDQKLKEKTWERIQEIQQRVETEEMLFGRESTKIVQEAIRQLPPRRKQIFKLSREKGLTHQDIANQLDISPNTVKNQIVSALKEIRTYLQHHTDIALCWMVIFLLGF